MISEGTTIKGSISSKSDIRIAGAIEGEVICKGKVIISSTALVEGNISSIDADIAGKVKGTIKIEGKILIRQSSQISGDIFTKALIVEEGALINGNLSMNRQGEEMDDKSASTELFTSKERLRVHSI